MKRGRCIPGPGNEHPRARGVRADADVGRSIPIAHGAPMSVDAVAAHIRHSRYARARDDVFTTVMSSVLGSGHPFDHFPGFPVRQKADLGGNQVRCETHGQWGLTSGSGCARPARCRPTEQDSRPTASRMRSGGCSMRSKPWTPTAGMPRSTWSVRGRSTTLRLLASSPDRAPSGATCNVSCPRCFAQVRG
jgi:hypothetical protein